MTLNFWLKFYGVIALMLICLTLGVLNGILVFGLEVAWKFDGKRHTFEWLQKGE